MENKAVPVDGAASIRPSVPAAEGVATTFDSIDRRAQQRPNACLSTSWYWGNYVVRCRSFG